MDNSNIWKTSLGLYFRTKIIEEKCISIYYIELENKELKIGMNGSDLYMILDCSLVWLSS